MADVLIVGAGPAGLALACTLARSGVSVHIIEAQTAPAPGSRAKGLQPRTLEVFDDLGIIETVLSHGRLAIPIYSTDTATDTTHRIGKPHEPTPSTPYAASLVSPQWRTEGAFLARLAELGVTVSYNVKFLSFHQSETTVTATVLDNGEEKTISASWLVGCDGGHSSVRRAAGIPFLGETFEDVRLLVADVHVEGLDREAWRMWRDGKGGFIGLCPLPSTEEFQLQTLLLPDERPDLSSLPYIQGLLNAQSKRNDIILSQLGWSSLWRENVRMVATYRSGRVFLAGDAAHVHPPAGGQGMNTGIQDGYNLGWKLAAVLHGASPALLDTYEKERLPVAAGVLSLSTTLLNDTISTVTIARDDRTLQLGVGYPTSSLSRDTREVHLRQGTVQAGNRAPDAPGLVISTQSSDATVCRLFDFLRGDHFTLLCFTETVDVAPRPWLHIKTVHVTDELDASGHLRAAYGLSDGAVVLIRPDGYIGLIAQEGCQAAVESYLDELSG
ncbi:hypothetical protein ASPZODRAFT_134469 [Penicilliopsis zonata CBS 506.65]|uniref:FAD-binding domain-containing protein n=1 Tax=Penicilliopsis zonata CBS 506.65 TaxID=1073090 RepID=A0A1L9SCU6_9EURO|nr:hypothetical protein ASPZODRAFT_134469 [Penicilliopsis zonata CBS 506.65]OJJ45040.1 hypothetical protein ASPZODRAFT_134469 [Penicilliopsis zonata CBS 506.65]